jgi:hypothetical protein
MSSCVCILELVNQHAYCMFCVSYYTGLFINLWNILKIRNKYTTQQIVVILTPIERKTVKVFCFIYLTDASTFGNTADIYAIVHLVPHSCQHITVDPSHISDVTVAKILMFTERNIWYYCLLSANQGNYVNTLFLKKNLESFSLYRRKNYHDLLRSLFVANF